MNWNHLRIFSPLPPQECDVRIRAALASPPPRGFRTLTGFTASEPDRAFAGTIEGFDLRLTKRIRHERRHDWKGFEPVLLARMSPAGSGTLIEGRFPIEPAFYLRLGGMYVLFGLLLCSLGPHWPSLAQLSRYLESRDPAMPIPICMVILQVGVVCYGQRSQTHTLTRMLETLLLAEKPPALPRLPGK